MGTRARFAQVAARAVTSPLALFAAAAVAATWPLILSPSRMIAGGLGDPVLNTTILAWDADRLAHGLRGFWDAPFLFPHRHTLAYSEHLLGAAWFTTPLIWASRNAVLAYNIAYIGSYAFAGFAMFLLVRHLVGRTDAAILAGLVFELTPYRLAQSTHLQVLLNGWMPIGLLALHRYFDTGERRWMAGFAAAYAVVGLSNGYYFYFFALPVTVVCAFGIASARSRRLRALADLAAAVCAVALVATPIAIVYYRLQQQHGFTRTAEDVGGLSARLIDYFHVPAGGWNWRGLLPVGGGERELFHGFVALGFAALAVTAVRTRVVAMYAIVTAAAVWLSMGPNGGPVYLWLFDHLPGFNGLRVPARLSSVVIAGIAVLAGAGFAWVLAQLPRLWGRGWSVAMACVILLEGQHGAGLSRVPFADAKSQDRAAYEWLTTSPRGATLELNITQQDDFHPFTTMYQFESVRHGHPILNGYSGWKSQLQEWLGGPESPLRNSAQLADALRGLRAIGVRYVLLHDDTFVDAREADRISAAIRSVGDQIAEEHRYGKTWAWRLTDSDDPQARRRGDLVSIDSRLLTADASPQRSRAELLVDGDVDTRWLSGAPQAGDEWIEVQLRAPADIARLELVTAARSLYDYPRHLAIESDGRPVFDGTVVAEMVEALAVDEQTPTIALDLPPNRTTRLRIRQTAHADRWWSVHEVKLYRRP